MTSPQDTLINTPVVNLPEEDRSVFIFKVYQHILAAIGVFAVMSFLFNQTGVAEAIYDFTFGSGNRGSWLLILGGFMVGQWFVNQAVSDLSNPTRQYAGLFGSAAIYAVLFAPMFHLVFEIEAASPAGNGALFTIGGAAIVTGIGFAILTAIGLFTRKDLSFIRPIVMWGFGIALLLIVGSVIMGWNLGLWFSVAMIALSGASILYQTQSILRTYPSGAYVAGAVHLFGSLMTMFWYVLRIFISRD